MRRSLALCIKWQQLEWFLSQAKKWFIWPFKRATKPYWRTLFYRTRGLCIHLKTTVITSMMCSGHQSTLLYSRQSTAQEGWTCGTLIMTLRYTCRSFLSWIYCLRSFSCSLTLFFCEQVPTASTNSESMTSLNRLRWTHSGHQISVGDDDGHVFIYDVGEVNIQ